MKTTDKLERAKHYAEYFVGTLQERYIYWKSRFGLSPIKAYEKARVGHWRAN